MAAAGIFDPVARLQAATLYWERKYEEYRRLERATRARRASRPPAVVPQLKTQLAAAQIAVYSLRTVAAQQPLSAVGREYLEEHERQVHDLERKIDEVLTREWESAASCCRGLGIAVLCATVVIASFVLSWTNALLEASWGELACLLLPLLVAFLPLAPPCRTLATVEELDEGAWKDMRTFLLCLGAHLILLLGFTMALGVPPLASPCIALGLLGCLLVELARHAFASAGHIPEDSRALSLGYFAFLRNALKKMAAMSEKEKLLARRLGAIEEPDDIPCPVFD